MMDVLVTQHSKWTARRIRRALFGQSLVDFSADPWRGVNDQSNSVSQEVKKKAKKKLSRLEREFSQTETQPSQATTFAESTQTQSTDDAEPIDSADLNFRNHYFQPNFQPSFQHPYFLNEQNFQQSFQCPHHHFHNEPYPQEQFFSTSFLEPALN